MRHWAYFGFLATAIIDDPIGRLTNLARPASTASAASRMALIGAGGTRNSASEALAARPVSRSASRDGERDRERHHVRERHALDPESGLFEPGAQARPRVAPHFVVSVE